MPNWCYTTIVFHSKNVKQIESFQKQVLQIFNGNSSVENDFHNGWLGDYVNYLLHPLTHDDVRCRGSVIFVDDVTQIEDSAYFQIETETAWSPMLKMWRLILEKHYPDIDIAFMAEESGCGIFEKYDTTGRFFEDTFDVDINIEDVEEFSYFHQPVRDKKELKSILLNVCDKAKIFDIRKKIENEESVDKISQMLNAVLSMKSENNYLYVNEYQEVDIFDVD